MTPIKIKKLLTKNEVNITILACALEVSPASVGQVINRKLTSTRIATAIAKAVNLDLYEVFPEYNDITPRYTPNVGESKQKIKTLKEIIT